MGDHGPKGTIDLDELVNSLLEKKQQGQSVKTPSDEMPVSEPMTASTSEVLPEPAAVAEEKPEAPSPRKLPGTPADFFAAALAESEIDDAPQPPAEEKRPKKRRWGKRRSQEPEEDWTDWDLTPIGQHTMQPPVVAEAASPQEEPTTAEEPQETPKAEAAVHSSEPDEIPAVQPVAETVTLPIAVPKPPVEDATRVVPAVGAVPKAEEPAKPEEEPPAVDEQLPDQLSLEELVRVEDIAPADEAGEEEKPTPEEQLKKSREERIRDFTLDGEEEEVNEPEEEMPEEPEEEPVIEDFTRYEDTRAVQLELQYRCRTAALVLALSAALELVMLALTLITVYLGHSPITPVGYLAVQLFALVLLAVLNYTAIGRGFSGLFMFRPNNDTAPAVLLATAIAVGAIHLFDLEAQLPVWPALVGIPVLCSALARLLQFNRMRKGFAFVSYSGEKYAASLVAEGKLLQELGQRVSLNSQEAKIAYFRPTAFLSSYLEHSAEEDAGDAWSRVLMPVSFGASLAISLVLLATGQLEGFWAWSQGFMVLLPLSVACTGLAIQLPLGHSARVTLSRGGFLSGWGAVRAFGHPDAVTVDVADLYPDESMLLHGIKTFAGTHIDDAILDAAALSIRSGGPLSQIFRRIIQDKTELLSEVDTLVYEQGMGLSGWVAGRRVLVGNRRLLQNHGVDVPSADYEARYAKNGRQLVYLSTAGELSAMFVVSYLPDAAIARALQQLCRSKMTILVRSCDQNITALQLCESFDLDEYYVDVLPAVAGRLYEQLLENKTDTAPAVLASNGHILGVAAALCACCSLRIKGYIALIVQLLMIISGLVLGAMAAVSGPDAFLLPALVLMGAGILLSWLLPRFKR